MAGIESRCANTRAVKHRGWAWRTQVSEHRAKAIARQSQNKRKINP